LHLRTRWAEAGGGEQKASSAAVHEASANRQDRNTLVNSS
jgi:hypothetical protein